MGRCSPPRARRAFGNATRYGSAYLDANSHRSHSVVVRGRRSFYRDRTKGIPGELHATGNLHYEWRFGKGVGSLLDRPQILAALDELAEVLHAQAVEGRVFVVGGAAMVLAFDARKATRDIDAIFEPKTKVHKAAQEVAARLGLPADWLNDAVKGYLPGTDPNAIPIFEKPGLKVTAASARYMLAMKLRAARVEQDAIDIEFLAKLLGLRTAEEVLKTGIERYGEANLPVRARYLVGQLFPE